MAEEHPTLGRLRTAVQDCRGRELYRDATQAVMGDGAPDASLLLLDRALADAGIDPAAVFKTNVVKHFRFAGTRGKQRIHKSPSQVPVETRTHAYPRCIGERYVSWRSRPLVPRPGRENG